MGVQNIKESQAHLRSLLFEARRVRLVAVLGERSERREDRAVAGAAAQVAREVVLDVSHRRLGVVQEQRVLQ